MTDVKSHLNRFEALKTRERVLIFTVICVLIYAIWSIAVGSAQTNTFKMLSSQVTALETKKSDQAVALALIRAKLGEDPDLALRRVAEQLKVDIQALDGQLVNMSVGLVPASELALILESVLLKTDRLKMLRLETLPVQELRLVSQKADVQTTTESAEAGVYKHAVLLTVVGDYFSFKNYLLALENLPWRFYWDELDYQVQTYPNAQILLKVYTLSTDPGVIGV